MSKLMLIIMFMFIISFFLFINFFNNLLMILMMLELMMLNLMMFLMFNMMMFNNQIEILYFLTFVVCESVLNLTILIMMIRNFGNDNFKTLNLILW